MSGFSAASPAVFAALGLPSPLHGQDGLLHPIILYQPFFIYLSFEILNTSDQIVSSWGARSFLLTDMFYPVVKGHDWIDPSIERVLSRSALSP